MAKLHLPTRPYVSLCLSLLMFFAFVSVQTVGSFANPSLDDAYATPSANEIYTQIRQASARVAIAKEVYNEDSRLKESASTELMLATSTEARLLEQSVEANQNLGKVAKDFYMNTNAQELTLVMNFIENGPQIYAADKELIDDSIQTSRDDVVVAVEIRKQLDAAVIRTNLAIVSYNAIVKKMYADLDIYQQAQTSFDFLMATNQILFSGSDATVFNDSLEVIPESLTAVARSLSYVGNAGLACDDGKCYKLCDRLAGRAWGYLNSGFENAREHWAVMVATGRARIGDTNPPIGALLFWDTGVNGHVALYVGNGIVVTNMLGPEGLGVYNIPASQISRWGGGSPYWGWSDPIFYGQLENFDVGGPLGG